MILFFFTMIWVDDGTKKYTAKKIKSQQKYINLPNIWIK